MPTRAFTRDSQWCGALPRADRRGAFGRIDAIRRAEDEEEQDGGREPDEREAGDDR